MRSAVQCLELLGLKFGATQEQIKEAYHDLVKVWHPDRFAHDPRLQKQAEEKLKAINEAHDFLMRPQSQAFSPGPRPAQSTHPPAPSRQTRPKDKYWMMPFVSFITLLIAIAIVTTVFYIYGRDYDLVQPQKTSQELL